MTFTDVLAMHNYDKKIKNGVCLNQVLCDLPKSVYQVLSYSHKKKTFSATVVKVYFSVFKYQMISCHICGCVFSVVMQLSSSLKCFMK